MGDEATQIARKLMADPALGAEVLGVVKLAWGWHETDSDWPDDGNFWSRRFFDGGMLGEICANPPIEERPCWTIQISRSKGVAHSTLPREFPEGYETAEEARAAIEAYLRAEGFALVEEPDTEWDDL